MLWLSTWPKAEKYGNGYHKSYQWDDDQLAFPLVQRSRETPEITVYFPLFKTPNKSKNLASLVPSPMSHWWRCYIVFTHRMPVILDEEEEIRVIVAELDLISGDALKYHHKFISASKNKCIAGTFSCGAVWHLLPLDSLTTGCENVNNFHYEFGAVIFLQLVRVYGAWKAVGSNNDDASQFFDRRWGYVSH